MLAVAPLGRRNSGFDFVDVLAAASPSGFFADVAFDRSAHSDIPRWYYRILLIYPWGYNSDNTLGGIMKAIQDSDVECHMVQSTGLENDPEAKKKIINRLRRAHGQLAAVMNAVKDDAHCAQIVQQLSAVSKAVDRAGFLVISSALQECLSEDDIHEDDVAQLEKLFMSFA